jgi:ferric-dicitrate binding protein FerR (iron transport regulator)
MKQYEHIDELIAKHFAEETSVAEEDIITNWIASSETNKNYFSEMKMIHEVAKGKNLQHKINVDAAWERFSKKLPEHTAKTPVIKKLTLSFYGKAALFICALGLAYLMYYQLSLKERLIVFSSPTSTTRSLTLPDGSYVLLNPKSSIVYSSLFNNTSRELKLVGDAYFRVEHNADLPFTVNTGNLFIKDVGTSFIIKATPADSTVMVHVEEGEVIFYSLQNSGITLIKNETGIYNLISKIFRKKEDNLFKPGSEMDQTLSFENTSLRFVIDTLNKVYNEHIILSCEKLESLELTATFKERTAAPIIETITETFGLSVTRKNGTVSLSSKDCK